MIQENEIIKGIVAMKKKKTNFFKIFAKNKIAKYQSQNNGEHNFVCTLCILVSTILYVLCTFCASSDKFMYTKIALLFLCLYLLLSAQTDGAHKGNFPVTQFPQKSKLETNLILISDSNPGSPFEMFQITVEKI